MMTGAKLRDLSRFYAFVLSLTKNFISTAVPIKIFEAAASARPIILTKYTWTRINFSGI